MGPNGLFHSSCWLTPSFPHFLSHSLSVTFFPVRTTSWNWSGKADVRMPESRVELITSSMKKLLNRSSTTVSLFLSSKDCEGQNKTEETILIIYQLLCFTDWVARDINGTALENAPFESIFRDPPSQHRFERHLPIQVQSCWNGIAILDPAPLYAHPRVRFRMAKLSEGECSASECSLICNDYWNAGYGRIVMVPRVKLAYDNVSSLIYILLAIQDDFFSERCKRRSLIIWASEPPISWTGFLKTPTTQTRNWFGWQKVWQIIHPERKNLTVIRGYTRLGGAPDDPTADPQDRSWFGPHDRLFRQEESEALEMQPEPDYGTFSSSWMMSVTFSTLEPKRKYSSKNQRS